MILSKRESSGRTGPPRIAFLLAAYAFAATMLGTTLPTPLYPIYQAQMGFSQLLVTVIFAAYAAGVICALILFGGLSDQLGRKRLLLAGIAFSAISAVAFLVGGGLSSLAALLIGRVLSGLSAGIFTGTATVAVVELAPSEYKNRATLAATAANIGGLGLGPVLAGALAQYLPLPLLIPFAFAILLSMLLIQLVRWMHVHLRIPSPIGAALVLISIIAMIIGSSRLDRLSTALSTSSS